MQTVIVTVKIILSIVFLMCLFDMPYGYFQLVRYIGMVGFGVLAYNQYQKDQMWYAIWFTSAILINPIIKIPVSLGRTTWNIIDVIWAILLIVSIFKNKITKISVKRISIKPKSTIENPNDINILVRNERLYELKDTSKEWMSQSYGILLISFFFKLAEGLSYIDTVVSFYCIASIIFFVILSGYDRKRIFVAYRSLNIEVTIRDFLAIINYAILLGFLFSYYVVWLLLEMLISKGFLFSWDGLTKRIIIMIFVYFSVGLFRENEFDNLAAKLKKEKDC